jgi:hypothetical protein
MQLTTTKLCIAVLDMIGRLKMNERLPDMTLRGMGRFGPIQLVLYSHFFLQVSVPKQERERSCICVLRILILPISATLY